jgi:hypothetical protein
VLSFLVCFSQWGIENFCIVFLYSIKERVTKTEIFQLLSKNGVAWLNVFSEGNERGQLLSIKINIRGFED